MKSLIYTLILATVGFVTVAPTYYFFANNYASTDLFLLLGSTAGLVLFVLLFWQYVLSLKILTKFLELDLSSVIELHKNIGIYSVMLLLIHPLYVLIDSLLNNGYLHIIPDFSSAYDFRVFLGQLSFAMFFFTWFTSYLIKKHLTFRFWKQIHLFAYIVLPLTYLHAVDIGSFIANQPINLFIKGLTFIFFVMVLLRILDASGIFKLKYKVKSKRMFNDVLELTLSPVNSKKVLKNRMGQFIYTQIKIFGEAHPFSILWNNTQTGDLTLGIKVYGEFSRKLSELPENSVVMIDGPHGKFLDNINKNEHIVFIAGGIGITPFVEFVGNSNNIDSIKRIDFFYATKTINDAIFVNKKTVLNWPKVKLVNVLSNQTLQFPEQNVESGMVTFDLIKKYMGSLTSECEYYICGPAPMMKAVTEQLVNNGVSKSKIHTEEFSW